MTTMANLVTSEGATERVPRRWRVRSPTARCRPAQPAGLHDCLRNAETRRTHEIARRELLGVTRRTVSRSASTGPRSDCHAVGWVCDRFVLFVPAHAVMLMAFATEHLEDLTSVRRLPVHATRLNPVTGTRAGFSRIRGHLFTSFCCHQTAPAQGRHRR